jgi:hypothetical protein
MKRKRNRTYLKMGHHTWTNNTKQSSEWRNQGERPEHTWAEPIFLLVRAEWRHRYARALPSNSGSGTRKRHRVHLTNNGLGPCYFLRPDLRLLVWFNSCRRVLFLLFTVRTCTWPICTKLRGEGTMHVVRSVHLHLR